MKNKILGLILCLGVASNAFGQATADDLVGLGMNPELADYVASQVAGGAVLSNNAAFKGRNAANSADISILKVDGSDETVLMSDSGDSIVLNPQADANRKFTFGASSDAAHTLTFGDGGTTASQTFTISGSTSDADDDSVIEISPGGSASNARAGYISLNANEVSSLGGGVKLIGGDVSTGHIDARISNASATFRVLNTSNTPVAIINNAGSLAIDDDASAFTTAFVATPATDLTPVVAVSELKPNTIIAAAGPTAQAIGIFGTPVAGQVKCVSNYSANPLILASMGTPVMNGGTNRTTSIPTLRKACCQIASAGTTYDCLIDGAFTRPTPIGG